MCHTRDLKRWYRPLNSMSACVCARAKPSLCIIYYIIKYVLYYAYALLLPVHVGGSYIIFYDRNDVYYIIIS